MVGWRCCRSRAKSSLLPLVGRSAELRPRLQERGLLRFRWSWRYRDRNEAMLISSQPAPYLFHSIDPWIRGFTTRDARDREVIDLRVLGDARPESARPLEAASELSHHVVHARTLGTLAFDVKAHLPIEYWQDCLTKRPEGRPPVEKVLAENLRALMATHLDLDSQPKLAKAAKLNQTTIGRVLGAKHRVQIDTLESLARAFHLEPYQLLIPGLNARNPQVLRMLNAAEERLYKALEDARKPGTQ